MSFLSTIAAALRIAHTVDRYRLAHDEAYRLAIVARLRGDQSEPAPRVDEAPVTGIRRAA
jgi:hypothetical protein